MKKIKYLAFLVFAFVFAFGVFKVTFSPQKINEVSAEDAGNPISEYFTISLLNQPLTDQNVKIVAPSPGNPSTRIYVFETGAATINFKPLRYRYTLISDTPATEFVKTQKTITVAKDGDGHYENNFQYSPSPDEEPQTYYFSISSNVLYIYSSIQTSTATLIVTSATSPDFVAFDDSFDDRVEIYLTESFTLKTQAESDNNEFSLSFNAYLSNGSATRYEVIFKRPAITFANKLESIVEFESKKTSWGDQTEVDDWIKTDDAFSSVKLKFLNSKYNYTKDTPLYFKLNFGGFNYLFTLYIDEGQNLFVNYLPNVSDAKLITENEEKIYLATKSELAPDGESEEIQDPIKAENDFSLTFDYRGRYALEIFDDTYLYNVSNPNYYSTSFYVKDDSGSKESLFNNIYIISQIVYQEEVVVPPDPDAGEDVKPTTTYNEVSEYIVNTSTQNHSVLTTVKNLLDPDFQDEFKLEDIVKYIRVSETLYGSSDNITNYIYYVPKNSKYLSEVENIKASSVEEVVILYLDDYLVDGDLQFLSTDDGLYGITVFEASDALRPKSTTYSFTIVTKAKATFTVDDVTHEAPENFKLFTEEYKKTIQNDDPIRFKISYGEVTRDETKLDKVYENVYSVSYGRQVVNITGVIEKKTLTITCLGVGSIYVEVTHRGEDVPFYTDTIESGDSIQFNDYGTYIVKITDSMGTTDTQVFKLAKKLNPSSIVLIVVSSLILVAIVVFVLISRSKPKTR